MWKITNQVFLKIDMIVIKNLNYVKGVTFALIIY